MQVADRPWAMWVVRRRTGLAAAAAEGVGHSVAHPVWGWWTCRCPDSAFHPSMTSPTLATVAT